jgi:hypothetical protein
MVETVCSFMSTFFFACVWILFYKAQLLVAFMFTLLLSVVECACSFTEYDFLFVNMILENRSHQLPLFGHFCCRLAAQPDCVSQESCSGDMMLLDSDAARQWVSMWGQLQAFRLDLWVKREHWEQGQDPIRSIVVDRVSACLYRNHTYMHF